MKQSTVQEILKPSTAGISREQSPGKSKADSIPEKKIQEEKLDIPDNAADKKKFWGDVFSEQ